MTEKKLPGRPIGRVARTITAVMMLKPIDPYQQSLSPVPHASLPPSSLRGSVAVAPVTAERSRVSLLLC